MTDFHKALSSALVVVHGGGREIDADMAVHGIDKHAVDGLRITDARTLEIVVGVLAGRVNTRLVATLGSMGVRAVGLTAADGDVASVRMAAPYAAAAGAPVALGFLIYMNGGLERFVVEYYTPYIQRNMSGKFRPDLERDTWELQHREKFHYGALVIIVVLAWLCAHEIRSL